METFNFEKVGDEMNGSATTLVLVAAAMFAFIGFMTVYKDNTEFEYLIVELCHFSLQDDVYARIVL